MKLEKYLLPSKYKTGNEFIDDQHSHLFSIIAAITSVLKTASTLDVKEVDKEIFELFSTLQEYSKTHFAYEERLMERSGYPEIKAHKEIHKSFITKIVDAQKRSSRKREVSAKVALIQEVTLFIKNWYLEHILIEDKRVATHLKEFEK